jgi:hypothetical protein
LKEKEDSPRPGLAVAKEDGAEKSKFVLTADDDTYEDEYQD